MATADTTESGSVADKAEKPTDPMSSRESRGDSFTRCLSAVFKRLKRWRNVIGFWIIGLCNNFPYVIMLSAAYDIIKKIEGKTSENSVANSSCVLSNFSLHYHDGHNETLSTYLPRTCHFVSTGAILLADILPTLLIKIVCPWWMDKIPFWIRILICTVASVSSFILVAAAEIEALIIFGVVCASIGSGFGEIVFLSFTSFFDKSTVSAWSSGTGAAGIGASLVYLGLTSWINLSPSVTLYIQTVVPIILLLTFIFIIKRPKKKHWCPCFFGVKSNEEDDSAINEGMERGDGGSDVSGDGRQIDVNIIDKSSDDETPLIPASQEQPVKRFLYGDRVDYLLNEMLHRVKLIPPLLKYMIPLFAVYVGEYLINQGLFELIYYPNTRGAGTDCFGQDVQYRWYQAVYQLGVFISRSSVNIIAIRHVWIFAILQLLNFAFFFCEAVFQFLPSFWLMIVLVLFEGLFGGATYVNAFYHIAKETKPEDKEFSMGIASVSDTFGITLAGICSIYVHNYICLNYVPTYTLLD